MFFQESPVLLIVFILLVAMSIASWQIIFLKILKTRAEQKAFRNFQKNFQNWSNLATLENTQESVGQLIFSVKSLEKILPQYNSHEAKREILAMHLLQTLDEIRCRLDKGLTILASIGSLAPFIGLFGTVWGIYGALKNIALQGNTSLAAISAPIGEALIATAIGLFAAIPAVLAYNSFVRINRLLVQNLRHIAEQLTVYLSNEAKKN